MISYIYTKKQNLAKKKKCENLKNPPNFLIFKLKLKSNTTPSQTVDFYLAHVIRTLLKV